MEGSPSYIALEKVINDKNLINDLKYLLNFSHTGDLEVYHSLYNKYCPKRLHFSYDGMIARQQLAVLNFNDNINKDQAKRKSSDLRYKQSFSKVANSWCIKPKKEEKKKKYIKELIDETIQSNVLRITNNLPKREDVPKNIAPIHRPNKKEAINNMKTRFEI